MDDCRIVELYWRRSESAINETALKYGRYCYAIANNILSDARDAQESVNDTYLGAWNSMPPHRPSVLSTFLGKITRRVSLKRREKEHAAKRGGELGTALAELPECLTSPDDVERDVELRDLSLALDRFLASVPRVERDVFVSRYWFLAPISEISDKFGFSLSKTKVMLFRTRGKLRDFLQKEGLD